MVASDSLGLPALAYVRSWASVAVDLARTGLAPVKAIPKALARAALSVDQVDLFEINEAFAATGARMIVTLVHELRCRGGGIGVAAMCAGGGMGSATVIEVPAP